MTPNYMEGCWEHFHHTSSCRFAGKQDWNGNTDEHFVIAQSTPPEQRAEFNAINTAPEAAHPEAVRMPPLDVTVGDPATDNSRTGLIKQLETERTAHERTRAKLQRAMDLVRHQRSELLQEKLISKEEYAALTADSEGGQRVARLETYDQMRVKLESLRQ